MWRELVNGLPFWDIYRNIYRGYFEFGYVYLFEISPYVSSKQKNSKKTETKVRNIITIVLVLLVLSQLVPEALFYIKMPYACTQDFRYVMCIIPAVALITAFVNKILVTDGSKVTVQLSRAICISTLVFIVSSTLLYCVCI